MCVANTLASLDSMAIEADGTVVVAAFGMVFWLFDQMVRMILRVDGPLITNVAFSREVTMSHTSQNLR